MNIAVVGAGYVGLVTGACLAELGNNVHCVERDEAKLGMLARGVMPIYEPGLESMVARNSAAHRLHFTGDLTSVLPLVELVIVAVGTPPRPDGSVDDTALVAVAECIGRNMSHDLVVVVKSTVPVGTTERVRNIISEQLKARGTHWQIEVASNPEFLKEGDAVNDFMTPDRVVVGVDAERAKAVMTALYRPMMLNNFRVLFMDIRSAEMTKYASNAMLATRISFMNEMANLCEQLGADVSAVRLGMGSDKRIGSKFLYPGCGYGGACFPKDIAGLIHMADAANQPMQVVRAVAAVNEQQKQVLFRKFVARSGGSVAGKHAAVWGLAFKPETDDMREAPSIVLIRALLEAGCTVSAYDPAAMGTARAIFGESISYAADPYQATVGADVLFHVTEWKEYRMPDWAAIRRAMRQPLIIDGRNVFEAKALEGFECLRIG